MIRVFSHYLSKGLLLLMLAELGVLLAALPVVSTLGQYPVPALLGVANLGFTLVCFGWMALFGLYRRDFDEGLGSMVLRVLTALGLAFLLVWFAGWLVPRLSMPTAALAWATVSAGVAILLLRFAFFRWADWEVLKTRVLVLGTGTRAARVLELLRQPESRHRLHIVGFLPLGGIHHFVNHSLILPDEAPLSEIVDKYQIDEIVIAIRERRGGNLPVHELLDCKLKGIRVVELSSFFERERGHVQLDSLNASWMVLSEGFRQGLLRDVVKRTFDLTVSAAILVVTLPVMLLAALAIVAESGFPILYRQERVGQGGRVFTIYKFRSMTQNAEADGQPRWAQAGDARITRVGRFIRKTRIDELPQLINVFKGDMSFVGPRPERPFFVNQLMEQIPYYGARHSIKPGVTGWAQVRYSYGASLEDAIEKLQYDLYYVKNHSFFLDLMILFETALVVLLGKGAR
ncbi:TIGR03013 family XrtA/PEP-CTERM system glycosyltransferase [Thiobacter aerophilum]|uniref:TIGR03013 family XrtA/PEP-CTERM system glycosyltransferase n=1 Tax=Thiobacter aerophilum TaxID=3121275 RepID=A0ABV0EGF9_9BURK